MLNPQAYYVQDLLGRYAYVQIVIAATVQHLRSAPTLVVQII